MYRNQQTVFLLVSSDLTLIDSFMFSLVTFLFSQVKLFRVFSLSWNNSINCMKKQYKYGISLSMVFVTKIYFTDVFVVIMILFIKFFRIF